MKTFLIAMICLLMMTNPVGKAAIVPNRGNSPIEDATHKANDLGGKLKELDSLLDQIK